MLTREHDDLRGYAICTQPRSGSNLLCQMLASTDRLGRPLEYFNGPARRALGLPAYPDEPHAQREEILRRGATGNGIYGVKLFAYQLDALAGRLDLARDLPRLRFVNLTRRDVVGQAISWAIAIQTGKYRSTQSAAGEARYDGALINARLQAILRERRRWAAFYAGLGVVPLEIEYEDLVVRPNVAVDRIALLMGMRESLRIDFGRVDLAIQRDGRSETWRRLFLSQHGDALVEAGHAVLMHPAPA